MKKISLIFGVTGQDGAYLSKLLLKKGYIVHGIVRRSSAINRYRIDKINEKNKKNFYLHYGDVTDSLNVLNLIKNIRPREIYNLAAQSHVKVSFDKPLYTSQTICMGSLNILESIRILNMKKVRYYQASSSEMFGNNPSKVLNEKSFFDPQSVYAASKVFSFYLTKHYRNAFNIFASNGILFNHESPWRGESFVTKKIVSGLTQIKFNKKKRLKVGNIYSKRDWGYAMDYVEGMWKILQNKKPDDYVLSTNRQITVKQFINLTLKELNMKAKWTGKKFSEKLLYKNNVILEIDKNFLRPSEVFSLKGDYAKAKRELSWRPKTNIRKLIKIMVDYEVKNLN